jgi:hypothetical protein
MLRVKGNTRKGTSPSPLVLFFLCHRNYARLHVSPEASGHLDSASGEEPVMSATVSSIVPTLTFQSEVNVSNCDGLIHSGSLSSDLNSVASIRPDDTVAPSRAPLSGRQTAIEALKFCVLWFIANYFSNAALEYTDVSSFTIISSMSGFFTLLIGSVVGVEVFTWTKLSALVIW